MTRDLVVSSLNNINGLLSKNREKISKLLPKSLTVEKMLMIADEECRLNPKLLECDPRSILGAIIKAASFGLTPGNALMECFLIPYGKECTFQLGYKGMLKLAYQSPRVSHVTARVVYEGDVLKFKFGTEEYIEHIPSFQTLNPLFVYTVVHLSSGQTIPVIMSKAQIEKIRSISPSGNSPAWRDSWDEMAKKTVIRNVFKYTPFSTEISAAVALDEKADSGISQDLGSIIETQGVPVEEPKISHQPHPSPQPQTSPEPYPSTPTVSAPRSGFDSSRPMNSSKKATQKQIDAFPWLCEKNNVSVYDLNIYVGARYGHGALEELTMGEYQELRELLTGGNFYHEFKQYVKETPAVQDRYPDSETSEAMPEGYDPEFYRK